MIDETTSAVLVFGILGMFVFEVAFVVWLVLSNHKWRKKQSLKNGVSGDVMEIKLQKCCCCGNEMILEPNGLCRVCSEECTKETLKDKPLATCGDAEK